MKDRIIRAVRMNGVARLSAIIERVNYADEFKRHTIRARISELVASGKLIRLIDARYAHDEAMRQQSRAMQHLKKAWKEKHGAAGFTGVVPSIDEPVVRRRKRKENRINA